MISNICVARGWSSNGGSNTTPDNAFGDRSPGSATIAPLPITRHAGNPLVFLDGTGFVQHDCLHMTRP